MIAGHIENPDAEAIEAESGVQIAFGFEPVGVPGDVTVGSVSIYLDAEGPVAGAMRVRGIVVAQLGSDVRSAQTEIIEVGAGEEAGWYTLRLETPLTGSISANWQMGFHFDGAQVLRYYGDPTDTEGVWATDVWGGGTDVIVSEDGTNPKPLAFADYLPPQSLPLETDSYYARLGFPSAQKALGVGGPESRKRAVIGWHGSFLDGESQGGSFGIVNTEGSLTDLLGERVKVTYGKRSVVVYVHRAVDLDAAEDLSLSRRAFMALAPLPTDELVVRVEALGAGE